MNSKENSTGTPGSAISRRAFVGALPIIGASLALPVSAAAPAEHPNEKVRRLSREIAEALSDPAFIGFDRVTITPAGVLYTDNDPEIRIAEAVESIKDALAEMHPGWRRAQSKDQVVPVVDLHGNHLRDARRAVLIYASDERYGPEEAMWWVRDAK